MHEYEWPHFLKSSVAQIGAAGIMVDIANGVPSEVYANSCVPHHILLSWEFPRRTLGQAWFGIAGAASRLVDVGNLTFIPAAVTTNWHFRPEAGTRRVIAVRFAPDMFNLLEDDTCRYDASKLASHNFCEPDIQLAMRQLGREALAPGFASKTLVESIGNNLLVLLARHFPQQHRKGSAARGGLAPWQMRRIAECIADESAVDSIPSLAELAALVGISTSYLRRAFKQSTGGTIGDYIRNVRLDRARVLLSGTNLTIGEIASRLGFTSHYGFTVAFRRESGETPSAFRLRQRVRQ